MSKARIEELNERIAQEQKNLKITKNNMARMKANNGPSHYQESGKRNIKQHKSQIKRYKNEIAELKGQSVSSKNSGSSSIFRGNILFFPFRLIWWFIKFTMK
ncbi:hypothetical protein [Flavobacterium sp. N2270]|uniref:hypothetical protein n=1 Tax=Flavobacterium sp. N2270 TaxID=2986831 RepID=UPI002224101C|nr:hypothetical protein [Flavobacterium sp. N2270]